MPSWRRVFTSEEAFVESKAGACPPDTEEVRSHDGSVEHSGLPAGERLAAAEHSRATGRDRPDAAGGRDPQDCRESDLDAREQDCRDGLKRDEDRRRMDSDWPFPPQPPWPADDEDDEAPDE